MSDWTQYFNTGDELMIPESNLPVYTKAHRLLLQGPATISTVYIDPMTDHNDEEMIDFKQIDNSHAMLNYKQRALFHPVSIDDMIDGIQTGIIVNLSRP